MCGIGAIVHKQAGRVDALEPKLELMNKLQEHRGPDGAGLWCNDTQSVGLAHRRLSIIDIDGGTQPMEGTNGTILSYNGEVYNYKQLRREIHSYEFRTNSDSEAILASYEQWGDECPNHLRGMFSFAIWDPQRQLLFCARDRMGIKPLYYTEVDDVFYCASEVKALLPFLHDIEVEEKALKEYLHFQLYMEADTLFKGIKQLPAGHCLTLHNGKLCVHRYWNVQYSLDLDHTEHYFERRLQAALEDSVSSHLVSDVPVGSYVSGGIDSSAIATLAVREQNREMPLYCGRFNLGAAYDESPYAQLCADAVQCPLEIIDINADDFVNNLSKVVYHLDYPVAGPGSFSQYMVSASVAKTMKVVLGGQGGDEIFGGYTRYLIAYFEQSIKGAINGTKHNANYIVDYDSMVPNLKYLKSYIPLLQSLFSNNLFGDFAQRYYQLINRSQNASGAIRWEDLGSYEPYDSFLSIFNANNVSACSLFDRMTHFDFKTLLPALLQVEDRVSMAHGLESRVPLLDHSIVELAATVPAMIKFKAGKPKRLLIKAVKDLLPSKILEREDKMGFPTPFIHWAKGEAHDFIVDIFKSSAAQSRGYVDTNKLLHGIEHSSEFSRELWGLLCLELWHQIYIDRAQDYTTMCP